MDNETRIVSRIADLGGPLVRWDKDIKDSHYRKGFFMDVAFCDNPECRLAHFFAIDLDERFEDLKFDNGKLSYRIDEGHDKEPLPTAVIRGNINIDTAKVIVENRLELDKSSIALLARVVDQLENTALLEVLRRRSRHIKKTNRDAWREKDWSWWQPGDLVGWFDVFPDEPEMVFEDGEHIVIADDMYCITPDCQCKDVTFSFKFFEKDYKEVGLTSVDTSKWTIETVRNNSRNQKYLRKLWKQLNENIPDLRNTIAKRQKEMKRIGKEISKLSGNMRSTQYMSSERKVGRNEPCPCGSGKKYKKCCLNKE